MTELKIYEPVIVAQENLEADLLAAYNEADYSFKEPFIRLNPYHTAPLTALVMFKTKEAVSFEVIVLGKNKEADIHLIFPKTQEHVLEIVGLYPDHKNKVLLKSEMGEELILEITTEPVNSKLPEVKVILDDPNLKKDQLIFMVPTDNQYRPAAYDAFGDCRWYSTEQYAYSMRRGVSGRFLVGAPHLLAIPYSPTDLYEISLLGKIYKIYRLPRGYHHDYFEIDEEKILLLTQNIEEGTSGDRIALFDKRNGRVLNEWDLKDMLPQDVAGSGSQDMHDWFHANSVFYDPASQSVTVSGRHQDIIVNFGMNDGKLRWMLGDPEGWPQDLVDKYFLKAQEDMEWFYEPHSVRPLEGNRFICFDTGHYRAKHKDNYVLPEKNYSRAVIYKIDPEKKLVSQEWQYGKELGNAFYSNYMGNITLYGESHFGIHFGGIARVEGKAIDMPGIFRKDFDPYAELYAVSVEWKEDREIGRVVANTNTYQGDWISLRHAGALHVWERGLCLGEYVKGEEFPVDLPAESAGFIPARYHLAFVYDGERLLLKGDFVGGEMVVLFLEGEKERHVFFVQSTRRPFYTMCPVTWRPGKKRPVEWPIITKDFEDCYRLKVLVNEHLYETGLTLDLRKEV